MRPAPGQTTEQCTACAPPSTWLPGESCCRCNVVGRLQKLKQHTMASLICPHGFLAVHLLQKAHHGSHLQTKKKMISCETTIDIDGCLDGNIRPPCRNSIQQIKFCIHYGQCHQGKEPHFTTMRSKNSLEQSWLDQN